MIYNIIYKTTNKINGKIYVGKHSTEDLNDSYLGSGRILELSISKYGKENFIREILEIIDDRNLVNEREIFWIEKLNSTNKDIGYNITKGGDGQSSEFMKELWNDSTFREKSIKSFTEVQNRLEVKEKISKSVKERWKDSEYRERITKNMIVAQNKDDTKEKISKSSKNLWQTSEYREKISESKKKAYKTLEVKEKLSAIRKGSKNPKSIFHYVLRSPNGEIFETDCLSEFSKEYNLTISAITRVSNGKRKQHKGWTVISKTTR